MSTLATVHIHAPGAAEVAIILPVPTSTTWSSDDPGSPSAWHPTALLDCWHSARKVGECIELEVEISHASFIPGRPARAWLPSASVSVSAGSGWGIVPDVARPWPSSWPTKRGAWRRYGLYPAGRPDLRGKAQVIARGDMLPSPNFASWGPLNMPIAELREDLAASLATHWAEQVIYLRETLSHGQNHYYKDANGNDAFSGWYAEDSADAPVNGPDRWVWWGPKNPDDPGGSGVFFSTGWQRCVEFARYALLACQPLHERMWLAYNRATGQPITVEDYGAVTPKYVPGTGDPNNDSLPEFRNVATSDPMPLPYDTAHRIRHDRYAIVAHEFTGSPMARRMVFNAAAQCRLQWTERGGTDQWCYDLAAMYKRVQAAPHQGLLGTYGGRSMGEPALVIAAARKFGMQGGDDWAAMFLDFLEIGAPPHGVIQRAWEPSGAWSGGPHDLAHSFEVPMLEAGGLAIARQFKRPVPRQIALALRSVFCNPALLQPYESSNVGPWNYLHVGAHDGASYAKLVDGQTTPGSKPGDATHAEFGCALGYSATKDPAFLEAMATVGLPAPSVEAKKAQLEAASGLDWSSYALGQLQASTEGVVVG